MRSRPSSPHDSLLFLCSAVLKLLDTMTKVETNPPSPCVRIWSRRNSAGLAPTIPEDLYHLIKKAVSVRKHLDVNRKDFDAKYRLRLIEARIHRLSRHFKTSKALPPTWRYESKNAAALVSA